MLKSVSLQINIWKPFCIIVVRVSFETSFDSKQPKLEPKLVSALSETKRLFRLFRFYIETASFGVSIESKQTEDQPKHTETPIFFHQRHLRIFMLLTR